VIQPVRPLMLGVVGDSAAGKTTLTRGIARIIGPEESTTVCLDDYHRYDRQERRQQGISALHPDANYVDIMEQQVNLLRLGQPILKPVYDHSQGALGRPEYVQPHRLVVVEGLLSLLTPALQKCYDITVYLEPDERLRRRWKIQRDTATRGYTEQEVVDALARRMPDSERYIWPQRKAADIIVRFWPPYGYFERSVDNAQLNVRIFQRHNLPRPDLRPVLEQAGNGHRPALRLKKDVWLDGQPVDILDIDGDIAPEKAAELETILWEQMPFARHLQPQELGGFREGSRARHSLPLALTQLLIAYHLLTVRRQEDARWTPLHRPPSAAFDP